MTQINPYLTFNGNCSEAMTFYKDCFGGKLILQKVAESPMADQWPADVQQRILHASLVNGGLMLLGSDMGSPAELIIGNTISLSLTCSSEEEINRFYEALSKEGRVTHALHHFFAGTIGSLTDKYGYSWTLYYDNSKNR